MTNNLYTKDLNIWFGSKHVLKGIDIEFPEKKSLL